MHLIHDSNQFLFFWLSSKKTQAVFTMEVLHPLGCFLPETEMIKIWTFISLEVAQSPTIFRTLILLLQPRSYMSIQKRIAGDRLKHVETKKQFNAIHSFLLVSDTTSQTLNPDILAIPGVGLAGLCHNMLLKERLFSNITRISRPSQANHPFSVRRKPMKQLQTWIWMPSPPKRFGHGLKIGDLIPLVTHDYSIFLPFFPSQKYMKLVHILHMFMIFPSFS